MKENYTEKKMAYIVMILNFGLAVFGIEKGVDLVGLGALMSTVDLPVLGYIFGRSYIKGRVSKND